MAKKKTALDVVFGKPEGKSKTKIKAKGQGKKKGADQKKVVPRSRTPRPAKRPSLSEKRPTTPLDVVFGKAAKPAPKRPQVRDTDRKLTRKMEGVGKKRESTLKRAGKTALDLSPKPPGSPEQQGISAPDIVNVARAFGYEIPKAYIDDPKGMLSKDVKLVRDTLSGSVAAVSQLFTNPETVVKSHKVKGPDGKEVEVPSLLGAIADDYKRRYGPITGDGKPDWDEFRRVVEEDGGLTYGLDVPLPAAVAGKGTTQLIKGSAAISGKGGKRLEAVTERRPDLRYGEGKDEVVRQKDETRKRTPNYFRAAGQKSADARRTKKHKAAAEAHARGEGPAPLPTGLNEVAATPRQAAKLRKKAAIRESGRLNAALKAAQAEKLGDITHAIANLSKSEERALKYLVEGTVGDKPIDDIVARIELIKNERKKSGRAPKGFAYDEVKNLEKLLKDPDSAFTPRVREIAEKAKDILEELEKRDPALTSRQAELRRYAKPAELLGMESPRTLRAKAQRVVESLERERTRLNDADMPLDGDEAARAQRLREIDDELETATQIASREVTDMDDARFIAQVDSAMQERGWGRPGYFPSHRFEIPGFADRAPGGTKATGAPKQYRGTLFRTGQERWEPHLLVSAMARSIKRDIQWNSVTDDLLRHADLDLSGPKGSTVHEIKKRAEEQGKDLDGDYIIISPNKAREDFVAQRSEDLDLNSGHAHEHGHELDPQGADDNIGDDIATALEAGKLKASDAAKPEFKNVRAYAIRKEYAEERLPAIVQNRKDAVLRRWSRKYDIGKSTLSRGMFFLNVPWVLANVIGNTLIAGVSPADYIRARRWFDGLSPELQRELAPEINVASRMQDLYKPALGASATGFAKTWRSFRQTSIGAKQPLRRSVDRWMQLEQKVANEPFFLGRLYKEMKNDPHFKDLDKHAGEANQSMQKLVDIADLPPERQLAALKANRVHFDHYVDNMHKALGDFTSLGSLERATVGRIMFYPWVRFSLRWTFKTMPVDHPVLTATVARLAQLHREELEEIYGEDVPHWILSKFSIFGQEFDARRFNPTGNILSEMRDADNLATTAFQAMPPSVNAFLSAASGLNFAEGARKLSGTEGNIVNDPIDTGRASLGMILDAFYAPRQVSKFTQSGRQTDASLPLSERRREYKRNPERGFQDRQVAIDQRSHGLDDILLGQLGILSDPKRTKLSLDRTRNYEEKYKKKPKKKSGGSGSSGFGGGGFGSGSGFGSGAGFGAGGF